jgi:pimeloyl-ACP methyl ester carboxylesterase
MKTIATEDLDISYDVYGTPSERVPVILLHGFPDDASSWLEIGHLLAAGGHYAIAPYVRGCGPTAFKAKSSPRSGQPSARSRDLIGLMDALGIGRAILIGQDWGATTAQATAILNPARVEKLVLLNGHGLFNMGVFAQGRLPSWETFHAGWYQWLFQSSVAKSILEADRAGFIRFVWTKWSPGWRFSEIDLAGVVRSAQNPDWIDVVLSAYRGQNDPAADSRDCKAETVLAQLPPITCPTLNLQGADDGVDLYVDTQLGQEAYYHGPFAIEVLDGCGHFLHRERPDAVAARILSFLA